ncbi:MAG: histidine kinase N-terminal 7TM domain-containing protein [Ignavibacteriales bacterium]
MREIEIVYIVVCLLLICTTILMLKIKNKKQLHYSFLVSFLLLFLWLIGSYFQNLSGYKSIHFGWLWGIGLCFLPVSLLINGIIFAKNKIYYNIKYLFLLFVPLVSYIILLTNSLHKMFFVRFAYINTDIIYGNYIIIHSIYSYTCLSLGLFYFLYFTVKNAGFFSKQSMLIFVGTSIPVLVNISYTFNLFKMPSLSTALSLSSCAIFYALAIIKFDFLNVVPIALEKVVDHISDSFIVINEDFEIIDFNKTFSRTFGQVFKIKRKNNLLDLIKDIQGVNLIPDKIEEYVNIAIETKRTNLYEKRFVTIDGSFDRYFEIEITPIMSKKIFIGVLILFRDITQHKQNIEEIKQTQNHLMQKERLASLGEIAGGVAHDINSPLSSIQTEVHIINTLAQKIVIAGNITEEKELRYLEEISKRTQNISNASDKIVKIVNSIRNHTRNLSGENIQDFDIGAVIEDLKILLGHHLRQSKCEMYVAKEDIIINGDPGKLSQVLTNLIMNAIQAYNGQPGRIEINIYKNGEKAVIEVTDYAGGIAEEFQAGIFKNILTTKGTEGTGLGLYLCNSLITGHFDGEMKFDSKEGEGTTFFVIIPIKNAVKDAV